MSRRRLRVVLAALIAMLGLAGALRWLWPTGNPVTVEQVVSAGPPATPPPAPVHGLIHEVDDREVATSAGDVHVRTMDGAYYDFQAVGEFVLLQAGANDLTVQVRQQPWQGSSRSISTNTAVALNVAGDRVSFQVRPTAAFYVNGAATPVPDQPAPLPKGGKLIPGGGSLSVVWPDQSEVEITPRGDYLDLRVDLAPARTVKVTGLLGNFDGDPTNDLTTRAGVNTGLLAAGGVAIGGQEIRTKLYDAFGNSWRIGQAESLFHYGSGESSATFTDLKFPYELVTTATLDGAARSHAEAVCRQAGLADASFLANCILDVAITGDARFVQSALKAQADVKLRPGFGCEGVAGSGARCTDYESQLAGARIGSVFRIDVETVTGDVKNTEKFDCSPIDAARRASCIIRTQGSVVVGAKVTTHYTLDDGEPHDDRWVMTPR